MVEHVTNVTMQFLDALLTAPDRQDRLDCYAATGLIKLAQRRKKRFKDS